MIRALVLALIFTQAVFLLAPTLDLSVSGWFYDPAQGFTLAESRALASVRLVLRTLMWVVGLPALALLLLAIARPGRSILGPRPFAFAVFGIVLGPGLLVNWLLKDHWGRARPADIIEFGGDALFSPPFFIADQCASNCSFPSGEAAAVSTAAMIVIALFWKQAARPARIWLLVTGIGLSLLTGGLRIATGRHFLSDVVFSFLLCALVLALLHRLLGLSRGDGLTLAGLRAEARALLGRPIG